MNNSIPSPCIGFCSTTYGDDFCKGCYRNFQEVIDWEKLPNEAKCSFYEKASLLAKDIIKPLIIVDDPSLLEVTFKNFQIEPYPETSLEYAFLRLLQKHSIQLKNLNIGIRLRETMTWSEFYMKVDKAMYRAITQLNGTS